LTKVGRNDFCPCGSGKKYKKCHGGIAHLERIAQVLTAVPVMQARNKAMEHQRAEQQGLGRPIISTRTDSGYQFVAVKNRLTYSKKWKTFHDFLGDYMKDAIGSQWGNAELQKPLDQRHPILVWYHKLCEQQRLFIKEPGKVSSARMTGATAAYMHLAYDLYSLDHNAELQAKLIERLHNRENFSGARYEVQIAATLVRAGFTLEFENEDDRSTSHCEFTATSTRTGKQFSVEAKRTESGRVVRPLVRALKKTANHTRIVFIDLNRPDPSTGEEVPVYVKTAFDLLRRFEAVDPQAKPLPPAYVFFTNAPSEHHLDDLEPRQIALGDSFHIDEFKLDHGYSSLRSAINGRQAHIEMHELLKSMRTHSVIPSTFGGENPEFAFVNMENRLTIGDRYLVPDADGTEVEGVLASAVVMEHEKAAFCAINTEDGRGILFSAPLSDAELAAWKKHPDTFFGEISRNRKSETALDLYDFFLETYGKTSKDQLLEFLAASEDIKLLVKLSQPQLASTYCERLAVSAFGRMWPGPKPLLESKWRASTVLMQTDLTGDNGKVE
jgi:SEC-C motif